MALTARAEMAAAMLAVVLASAAEVPADDDDDDEDDRQDRIDLFEALTVMRARELFERTDEEN